MAEIDPRSFPRLKEGVAYRGLEMPHLFNILRDDLYELDDTGIEFLAELDLGRRVGEIRQREALEFALSEGLIELKESPSPVLILRGQAPNPSLRYLETILTLRCNLACKHCYIGNTKSDSLNPDLLEKVLAQFDAMQGLRLLLSGGEPLLYPFWSEVSCLFLNRGFRVVLLSNGILINEHTIPLLLAHEVQLSLDGLRSGHEAIRGPKTFDRTVAAARMVRESGRDLSIATMIHAGNLAELDGLEALVHELGAREWSLEVPTGLGRWQGDHGLALPVETAAREMARAFGGSYHGSAAGHACGYHLAALLPDGNLAPCGFYSDEPLGNIGDVGMAAAWAKKRVKRISEIDGCRDCDAAESCGGGCRYRAGGNGPDPVMCRAYGKNPAGILSSSK